MRSLIEGDEGELPAGLRPSAELSKIRDARVAKVYDSSPWRSFWLEKQRTLLAAPSSPSKAALSSGAAVKDEELAAAQKRIWAALFERFDTVQAALKKLDINSDGLLSEDELSKGLSDLRLGLTAGQIRALVAKAAVVGGDGGAVAAGGVPYVLYNEFIQQFGTPESDLVRFPKHHSTA